MPTKKTTSADATPKARKPRPTAAERRAAEAAIQAKYEAEREAKRQAFLAIRSNVWFELFAKALRVHILMEDYPEVTDTQSWWFDSFSVSARDQSVRTEDVYVKVTLETLEEHHARDINQGLDNALQWFADHDAEQERLRQEALALEARRKAARAKLTDQEARDLGIR
jgi:hypothetical protein